MAIYSLRGRCAAVLLAFAGAGCATLPPTAADSLKRLSKNALRLELPAEIQGAPDLCGLAAVDMLTHYYQRPLSAPARQGLQEEAKATDGISGASLKAVLEEAGYYVAVFPGTLDHALTGLYRHLDLRRPLIVMTGAAPRHYAVAVGYDEARGLLVLLDPALGAMATPAAEFTKGWKEANYFTLLAMPDKNEKPE